MHSSRSKQKYEKSALRISITGSTIFVILEIVMAVITRSQAVLLDSVYDGVEILKECKIGRASCRERV